MINYQTTSELEQAASDLDGHDCTHEDDCPSCLTILRIERELDARELWESDDDRVRESVGNYGRVSA